MGERTITKDGYRVLQNLLGLTQGTDALHCRDNIQDVALVSIDFENLQNLSQIEEEEHNFEVGLAILQARDLRTNKAIKRMISTYGFACGSSTFCERTRKRFLFGNTRDISREEVLNSIHALLPSSRQIVLVGHGVISELRILQQLGFEFTNVIAILDTMLIAMEVQSNCSGQGESLVRLLETYGCPYNRLHCAGNDAHFTLRLLLLLAGTGQLEKDNMIHLERLKEIGQAPIPYRADKSAKARKKKVKRLQKTRKYQSKFWDDEKKDQIRAERAAKRDKNSNLEKAAVEVSVAAK